MALLFAAFIVPLCAIAGILIGQQTAKIALTDRERDGLAFTTRTMHVVGALRTLRDRMDLDRSVREGNSRAVDAALGVLYDYNSGDGRSLELTKRLSRLEGEWALVSHTRAGKRQVAVALSTAVCLFDLSNHRSSLTADPDDATADLIDSFGEQLPIVAQRVEGAKLILVRALSARRTVVDDRIAAAVSIGQASHAAQVAQTDFEHAAKSDAFTVGQRRRIDEIRVRLGFFVGYMAYPSKTFRCFCSEYRAPQIE